MSTILGYIIFVVGTVLLGLVASFVFVGAFFHNIIKRLFAPKAKAWNNYEKQEVTWTIIEDEESPRHQQQV
jgi:hypothetical protein